IKYFYDRESNLIFQQDENGVIIRGFYTPGGFLYKEIPDLSNFFSLPSLSYLPSDTSASLLKYTPIGNFAIVQNDDASLILRYDSLGRLTEEISNGKSIQYRYDELGRQIGLTYPDGRDIRYTYSSAGYLTGIHQNNIGSAYPGDISLSKSR